MIVCLIIILREVQLMENNYIILYIYKNNKYILLIVNNYAIF